MTHRLQTRLTKLETTRRKTDARADDPNRPRTFAEIMAAAGCPYDPSITLPMILARATYSAPPPPDDVWEQNVINVDSEFCKITGDLEGWRENEKKIKRWSPEWEKENWPDVQREGESAE